MGDKASMDGPVILTKLEDVVHYIDPNDGDVDDPELLAVQLQFDEGFLLVEVDPVLDEVELSFTWFRPEALTHRPEARRRP